MAYPLFQVVIVLTSVSFLSQAFGQQCKLTRQSEQGFVLVDHVFKSISANRLADCYIACNIEPLCQSLNYNLADKTCQFNNETQRSKPDKLKNNDVFVYAENPDRALFGSVSTNAAKSCQHIANIGDSTGNGEYWIDPQGSEKPFKVFCDMVTDGGGWLMVANFVMKSSSIPSNWKDPELTYEGISNHSNNEMGIQKSAMYQLRAHMQFNQLRFHCSKKTGTTFHVKTTLDNRGEAVVQYFSGQTDVLPGSCDSFVRMGGDTSRLATQCDRWGNDNGHYVGKWGHFRHTGQFRILDYAAFVANQYHWHISARLCDDRTDDNLSSGDFWKIYVR